MDVYVEQSHIPVRCGQGGSQVHCYGALTHASFAGKDHQDILDSRETVSQHEIVAQRLHLISG